MTASFCFSKKLNYWKPYQEALCLFAFQSWQNTPPTIIHFISKASAVTLPLSRNLQWF
jgi:hypothetical protein